MPLRNNVTSSDNLKGLSENDVALLREMAAQHRATVHNPRLRPVMPPSDKQTPETYIVLTPEGGIPAMTETETGTGVTPDNPGSATCRIFQRFALTNELQDLGFTEDVFNLSLTAIVGNQFVLATRSKEGDLHVIQAGSGGGAVAVVWVEDGIPGMTEAETGTGSRDIDNPGSASCQIYTREPTFDELTATGIFVTVYNISTTPVARARFIMVGQDALGDWWVLGGVLDATVVVGVVTTCIAGVPNTTTFTARIQLP